MKILLTLEQKFSYSKSIRIIADGFGYVTQSKFSPVHEGEESLWIDEVRACSFKICKTIAIEEWREVVDCFYGEISFPRIEEAGFSTYGLLVADLRAIARIVDDGSGVEVSLEDACVFYGLVQHDSLLSNFPSHVRERKDAIDELCRICGMEVIEY